VDDGGSVQGWVCRLGPGRIAATIHHCRIAHRYNFSKGVRSRS
jgi:hypothetical protein